MFSLFSPKPHPAVEVMVSLLTPVLTATKRTGQPLRKLVQDQYVPDSSPAMPQRSRRSTAWKGGRWGG